jgi:hypothetical protein
MKYAGDWKNCFIDERMFFNISPHVKASKSWGFSPKLQHSAKTFEIIAMALAQMRTICSE